jgi:virginiamycin B lyase
MPVCSTGSKSTWRSGAIAALLLLALAIGGCASEDAPGGASATPTTESPAATSKERASAFDVDEFDVPAGTHPHDVAPAADGGVWYTAQRVAALGYLDPRTKRTEHIDLGEGSAPHGVITGPDGAPWITDGGRNEIIRVDPETKAIERFTVPQGGPNVSPHTAAFDPDGVLWFTGQSGYVCRLDPDEGEIDVFEAPGGAGPYGITSTPDGDIYYASLQNSFIASIDKRTGRSERLEPPTSGQGARRVWSDSSGRIWVSEWIAGKLARYDPGTRGWKEWDVPGDNPMAYAVYVDETDIVWVSDFGANALQRFDPKTQDFTTIELPSANANVRQILGSRGEIWGAESGVDKIVRVRTT